MARNKLAGKHSSYDERGMSDKAIAAKGAYDKAYGAQSALIKYRALLNKKNKEDGTYGNGDKKDVAHPDLKHQSQSRNRAGNRQRKGVNPGRKRKPLLKRLFKRRNRN